MHPHVARQLNELAFTAFRSNLVFWSACFQACFVVPAYEAVRPRLRFRVIQGGRA